MSEFNRIKTEFEREFGTLDLGLLTNGMCVAFANGKCDLVMDITRYEDVGRVCIITVVSFKETKIQDYHQNGINVNSSGYSILYMSKGAAFDLERVNIEFKRVYKHFLPSLVKLMSLKSGASLELKCMQTKLRTKQNHYHNGFSFKYLSLFISFVVVEKGVNSECNKIIFTLAFTGLSTCYVRLVHNLDNGTSLIDSNNGSVTMIQEMAASLEPIIAEIKEMDNSFFPDFKVEYITGLFGSYIEYANSMW